MPRHTTVVNLDPIDTKKEKGFIGRLLVTRWFGGKKVIKDIPFGHYMFCGPQGSGKTSSALWYAVRLRKKYSKKRLSYKVHDKCDDTHLDNKGYESCTRVKFDDPPRFKLYSNFGVGREIDKKKIAETIWNFNPYANEIRIVILDEIHTYFPRDNIDKETKEIQKKLINLFSQLRKRNTFVLSTAQVYGRLDKSLREQCLFMINCKVSLIRNRLVNDMIRGDDIIADDLGRWKGDPVKIYVHGLAPMVYDTKRVITD